MSENLSAEMWTSLEIARRYLKTLPDEERAALARGNAESAKNRLTLFHTYADAGRALSPASARAAGMRRDAAAQLAGYLGCLALGALLDDAASVR